GEAAVGRTVVSQSLSRQWTAGKWALALPHGENPPIRRDNLLAGLHVAFRAVFPDEHRLAPGRAVVDGAHVVAPSAERIRRKFRSKRHMHGGPTHRHPRA